MQGAASGVAGKGRASERYLLLQARLGGGSLHDTAVTGALSGARQAVPARLPPTQPPQARATAYDAHKYMKAGCSPLWRSTCGGVGQQQGGERGAVGGQRWFGHHRHTQEGGGALALAQLLCIRQLGDPVRSAGPWAAIRQGLQGVQAARRATGPPLRPSQPLTRPPPARRCGPSPGFARLTMWRQGGSESS